MHKMKRSVAVNQIGYPINGQKTAIVTEKSSGFHIAEEGTNKIVYRGNASPPTFDLSSGSIVRKADFSELSKPGTYVVVDDEGNRSTPFVVEERPYVELHNGLLKAFYYLRCGVTLDERYAGKWGHESCHTTLGAVHGEEGLYLDGNGGWHDAGDYGKYVVAGAKAVADLLLAYEMYPKAFSKSIPLPESDQLMPDVLHECKVELDFLFKMQDKRSGGVYHKLTTRHFPGLSVMPEDDLAELVFSPISAAATASYAAIMAFASRIYRSYDPSYADKCLNSAEYAWEWIMEHPEAGDFKNPPDITTGEYGDDCIYDEKYWAAAELYHTTNQEEYHFAFRHYSTKSFSKCELGWADVGGYGTISYLRKGKTEESQSLYTSLQQELIQEAERLLVICEKDGYGISLEENDYIWGSNMVLMNRAMLLLIAREWSPKPEYVNAATQHLHYLLGKNTLYLSYVTGFGTRSVMNPHHRPSVGDHVDAPVPGMVVGGPNRNLNDEIMEQTLKGKPAAASYIDHEDSYAGNEITIYWNSPAVFVVSYFNQ
ncbi:glycoside hydrolase family 9 protein [Paenibacillus sp. Marseille-Q4541]|uniref:glycoside hydrolase family 9 protein n=1 Tax=Paenibacillus sp. Marseille-Q4541 TaxID=2831522 RepID=UPI001BA69715|nr:glycoside hydrolase family 9 protein [Paenibacillus sp. Marseille-Q4541]